MKIEVLMSPGCGHGARARELVADVVRQMALGAEVETITVATMADANPRMLIEAAVRATLVCS